MKSTVHCGVALSVAALTCGCMGTIGEGQGGSMVSETAEMPGAREASQPADGTTRVKDILPSSPLTALTCTESARGTTEEGVRRLSKVEVDGTLRVLLTGSIAGGGGIYAPIKDALYLFPSDVINDSLGEFEGVHSDGHVAAVLGIAEGVAQGIMDTSANRLSQLGSCGDKLPLARECAQTYVRKFASAAFRRPIPDAELADLLIGYDPDDGRTALKIILKRVLQSPHFLFHVELGQGSAVDGRVRLTDTEIAARIAYRITLAPPDALLYAAAARPGELQSQTNVSAQVRRLLLTPAAQTAVHDFYRTWLRYRDVPRPDTSNRFELNLPALEYDNNHYLVNEATKDADAFLGHVTWTTRGTFQDLMLSNVVFPIGSFINTVYGLPTNSLPGQPVAAVDGRMGLLGRALFLLSEGRQTHPITRGAWIRKNILCDRFPPPDPAAVAEAQSAYKPDRMKFTTRQLTEQLTGTPQCAGCHRQMNGIGYAFEGFGVLGHARSQEKFIDGNGRTLAVHPLDTAVADLHIEDGLPTKYAGAKDLIEAIARTRKARGCFARKLFEFSRHREAEVADGCVLRRLDEATAKGASLFDVLADNVANEDLLWRRAN